VRGLDAAARIMKAFFVVPAARREGTGLRLAGAEIRAIHADMEHLRVC